VIVAVPAPFAVNVLPDTDAMGDDELVYDIAKPEVEVAVRLTEPPAHMLFSGLKVIA
jgi:hypothetical protein